MKIAFFEAIFTEDQHPHHTITKALHWHRIVNPAKYLQKTTNWEIEIFKNPFDKKTGFSNWDDICTHFDIGYFPYFPNYRLYTYLLLKTKKKGMKIVIDFDDDVWGLTPNHRLYPVIHLGSAIYHFYYQMAKTAPFLTTTNNLLKKKLSMISTCKRIEILPNYIDLDQYKSIQKHDSNHISIIYFGTNNHKHDIISSPFKEALVRIVQTYPNVLIKIVGMDRIPEFNRSLNQQYIIANGNFDYFKFLQIWQDHIGTADISIAPLERSNFSRSKSPLKFYESAAGYLPFVCSDILPYRGVVKHGVTGFLCKTEDDWYQALSKLIESKELRKKIGDNAYDYVKKNCTIQKNIWRYKEFFEKVYNTKILNN